MTDYMAKSYRAVLYYKHNNVIHGTFGKNEKGMQKDKTVVLKSWILCYKSHE